ncbi:hypothetical protein AB0D57_28005 [Streptomyces sp. NPDC048275]|uniref:hypothetical protein n=1 Tax=Streptomyces sp. NPDC048275 TaxID=3155629 RepID=UPI0033D6CA97
MRARENARRAGAAFPTAGVLSQKLITQAKQTPERSWLGEVSSVVLQQSLRDAESAYRKPRIPARTLCRVAAQGSGGEARILGLQPEERVKR